MKLFLWELNYVNNKMHTYFMAVMLDDSYIFRFGRLTEHSLHSGISQFLFPISAHSWGSPTKFTPTFPALYCFIFRTTFSQFRSNVDFHFCATNSSRHLLSFDPVHAALNIYTKSRKWTVQGPYHRIRVNEWDRILMGVRTPAK